MSNYERRPNKYPVVDPDPDWKKQIRNFNVTDILSIGAFTAGGYGVGWFGGIHILNMEIKYFQIILIYIFISYFSLKSVAYAKCPHHSYIRNCSWNFICYAVQYAEINGIFAK